MFPSRLKMERGEYQFRYQQVRNRNITALFEKYLLGKQDACKTNLRTPKPRFSMKRAAISTRRSRMSTISRAA